MHRRYLLPLTSIGLGFTTACTPAIVGDWDGLTLSEDGETYTLPYSYTATHGDVTVTYSSDVDLSADGDGTAQLIVSQELTTSDGSYDDSDQDTVNGTWEKAEGKEFALDFPEEDIFLDCTVAEDELSCSDEDVTVTFERL